MKEYRRILLAAAFAAVLIGCQTRPRRWEPGPANVPSAPAMPTHLVRGDVPGSPGIPQYTVVPAADEVVHRPGQRCVPASIRQPMSNHGACRDGYQVQTVARPGYCEDDPESTCITGLVRHYLVVTHYDYEKMNEEGRWNCIHTTLTGDHQVLPDCE